MDFNILDNFKAALEEKGFEGYLKCRIIEHLLQKEESLLQARRCMNYLINKGLKKFIYVCSPLKGEDFELNLKKAADYSRQVVIEGGWLDLSKPNLNYIPITPHLYFTAFLDDRRILERTAGMRMGVELLALCDEMWLFGDKISEGMETEIAIAQNLKIPINTKYFTGEINHESIQEE